MLLYAAWVNPTSSECGCDVSFPDNCCDIAADAVSQPLGCCWHHAHGLDRRTPSQTAEVDEACHRHDVTDVVCTGKLINPSVLTASRLCHVARMTKGIHAVKSFVSTVCPRPSALKFPEVSLLDELHSLSRRQWLRRCLDQLTLRCGHEQFGVPAEPPRAHSSVDCLIPDVTTSLCLVVLL